MSAIVTGSRLHFGLFQPGPPAPGQRRFGGAGMMVDRPGLRLSCEPAASWSAEGPLAERALAFARRIADALGPDRHLRPQRLIIERAAPEHAGLGTGTQLGLAVARILTHQAGLTEPAPVLAALVGRGRRSALGVHGFEHGGFLVDGGQREPGILAPLVARVAVPEDWRIVLISPPGDRDWHGVREQQAFERLAPVSTERLCRLVLLGLLPALAEKDIDAFGEALHDLNVVAGEAFAAAQGGSFAGPQVAEVIRTVRGLGVRGTGQSSWGPTVFAIVGDAERASFVARETARRAGLAEGEILIASPFNRGAVLL
jgi:beta-RFAP synthase